MFFNNSFVVKLIRNAGEHFRMRAVVLNFGELARVLRMRASQGHSSFIILNFHKLLKEYYL